MTASPFGPGFGPNMTLQPALHRFSLPSTAAGPIFAIIEFLALTLSPCLGSLLYHSFEMPHDLPPAPPMIAIGAVMAVLYLVLSNARGAFDLEELRSVSLGRPLACWCMALIFFAVISFTFEIGDTFSRGAIITSFVVGALTIAGLRLAIPLTVGFAFRHRVLEGRRAILLSDGPLPSSMPLHELMRRGVSVHGWFETPSGDSSEDQSRLQKACRDIKSFARDRRIEDIVVIADAFRDSKISTVLEELRVLPLRVLLVPAQAFGSGLRPPQPLDVTAMALTVQTPPFTSMERRVKRVFDVTVASAILLLISPLFALIALAIRRDSRGPVLFRQSRIGFAGRRFMIFKFRTMHTVDDGPVIKQAEPGDVRITRVGRFLRETSLDELPQLLNVIAGDMSLVGPRPHAVAHDRYYEPLIPGYAWRHQALPGMTGWAQVNGFRGPTQDPASMDARVAHDLWYIRHWSIWLDVKILFMTVGAVLKQKNAH